MGSISLVRAAVRSKLGQQGSNPARTADAPMIVKMKLLEPVNDAAYDTPGAISTDCNGRYVCVCALDAELQAMARLSGEIAARPQAHFCRDASCGSCTSSRRSPLSCAKRCVWPAVAADSSGMRLMSDASGCRLMVVRSTSFTVPQPGQ